MSPTKTKLVIIDSERRKKALKGRYPNRGERMTGGEGACLDFSGDTDEQTRQAFGGLSLAPATSHPGHADDPRELFLELRAPVCRYLVSLGLDRAAAEDVAQESFVKLCERGSHPVAQEQRPSDKGGARRTSGPVVKADLNIRGWIFRVAHNLARDEQRRKVRRPTEQLVTGESPQFAQEDSLRIGRPEFRHSGPSPEETLLEREKESRLKCALSKLPEEQRQCLHLRAEGLRYREIAEVLGAGTSTVAEWIQKGLKQLERELA